VIKNHQTVEEFPNPSSWNKLYTAHNNRHNNQSVSCFIWVYKPSYLCYFISFVPVQLKKLLSLKYMACSS